MGARRPHAILPLVLWLCAVCAPGAAGQPLRSPVADGGPPGDAGRARAGAVATTAPEGPPGAALRVGFTGSPPFVSVPAGGACNQAGSGDPDAAPQGLSIAVWQALAEQLSRQTRWQRFDTVPALLDAVAEGHVDVGVGPISVTASRAETVDFTQPYFSARVGVLAPAGSGWDRLRPFFNRAFGVGVMTLVLVLLCVGTLVWFLERKRNQEQFPERPVKGIPEGMWFALVTMTTVGYGDRTPVTGAGRVVAGIWMVFAMVAASSMTAGIATALTLSQIDTGGISGLADIKGTRVAVVRGTPAVSLVAPHGGRPLVVDSLDAGVDAIGKTWAGAMLYDLPVLDHYAQTHPQLDLVAHPTAQHADDYAFAVAIDSPLRRPLSRAVLSLREQGMIAEIAEEWSVQP